VLAGHDVGEADAPQTVRSEVLRQVCAYALDPANGVWLGTIEEVAWHVKRQEQVAEQKDAATEG
jgi:hypothetical protein